MLPTQEWEKCANYFVAMAQLQEICRQMEAGHGCACEAVKVQMEIIVVSADCTTVAPSYWPCFLC